MAQVEFIDPETGEITHDEYDIKVVNLDGQTRFQREARAMVKREYARLSRTYLLPLDETLKLTQAAAQSIAKSLVADAMRALVDEIKPKQISLPLPPGERRPEDRS